MLVHYCCHLLHTDLAADTILRLNMNRLYIGNGLILVKYLGNKFRQSTWIGALIVCSGSHNGAIVLPEFISRWFDCIG